MKRRARQGSSSGAAVRAHVVQVGLGYRNEFAPWLKATPAIQLEKTRVVVRCPFDKSTPKN